MLLLGALPAAAAAAHPHRSRATPCIVQAVYTTLREAEYRSTYPIAYWNIVPLR